MERVFPSEIAEERELMASMQGFECGLWYLMTLWKETSHDI
jgi:hypothetical protein